MRIPAIAVTALAAALRSERSVRLLVSGDHVMGWSTIVISAPDGDMSDGLAPAPVPAAGRSVFTARLRLVDGGKVVAARGESAVDSDRRLAPGCG